MKYSRVLYLGFKTPQVVWSRCVVQVCVWLFQVEVSREGWGSTQAVSLQGHALNYDFLHTEPSVLPKLLCTPPWRQPDSTENTEGESQTHLVSKTSAGHSALNFYDTGRCREIRKVNPASSRYASTQRLETSHPACATHTKGGFPQGRSAVA